VYVGLGRLDISSLTFAGVIAHADANSDRSPKDLGKHFRIENIFATKQEQNKTN